MGCRVALSPYERRPPILKSWHRTLFSKHLDTLVTMRTLRLLLIVLVAVGLTACDDFLDINEDPNAATEADPELLFPTILANTASNRAIEFKADVNFFPQVWSSAGAAGVFNNPERYVVSPFSAGNTWNSIYQNQLKELDLIVQDAEANGFDNIVAQAQIMSGWSYLQATELYGPIPFSEAINPDIARPAYDEQEDVLRGIVDLLEEAKGRITDSPIVIGDADLIYGGNMEQWERFANSIQMRALMLLRNGGASVDGEINAQLGRPMIRSVADIARIPFFDQTGNENNLWKLLNQFSGGQNIWIHAGEPVIEIMNRDEDPRRATFFDENSAGEFAGSPPGVLGGDFSFVSLNIMRPDYPEILINPAEILLLEAEFLEETGSSGRDKLEAGVRASMDFYDGQPGAIDAAEKDAFIGRLLDRYDNASDKVEVIQEQLYVALTGQNPEGWTNWRRTKVPALELPQEAVFNTIIRRYPLPDNERTANAENAAPFIGLEDVPMWFEGE